MSRTQLSHTGVFSDVYYDDFCSAEQCVVAPVESRRGRAPSVAFSKQEVENECAAACDYSAQQRARFHTKPVDSRVPIPL